MKLLSTVAACVLVCLHAVSAIGAPSTVFESPHVHPLDRSTDGSRLFAVNTDDHRLAVFDLTQGPDPVLMAEIPVGLEPVTVRSRNADEVWVVNHVSGTISILHLPTMNVRQTLLVGFGPTDVVFAGNPPKAFVCVSKEDLIRVYDAASPGNVETEIPLDGSDPRSLAVGCSGNKIYVTVLDSGNRTTIVPRTVVAANLGLPPPNPPMDPGLPPAPETSLIVRHNGTNWVDELGRSWDAVLPYQLLDNDLIEIDVAGRSVSGAFGGLGTTLFNAAVNPVTGAVYVSNQEAANEIRFEPNLSGQFVKSRVSVVHPGGGASSVQDLNPHIDYGNPAGSPAERAQSLSIPLDMVVNGAGDKVFVSGFGSSRVGVLDGAGVLTNRIAVGGGPTGLALDEPRNRLYVFNRFDVTISAVSLGNEQEVATVGLGFDPLPTHLRQGRERFYGSEDASAHGDISCASCHVFAASDNIAWDLGDPRGVFLPPPAAPRGFHPMKGPMTTLSLKGLPDTEPLHWRGDRADLAAFNPAFASLMGRESPLSPDQFQLFEDFVNAVQLSKNPFLDLSNRVPASFDGGDPVRGKLLFRTGNLLVGQQCVDCHALPSGQNGDIIDQSRLNKPQDMAVPHLRNLFEKTRFEGSGSTVRGFGYTHDGAVTDLFTFLTDSPEFQFTSDKDRRDVHAFLMTFDSGTHAGIGAQWTMNGSNQLVGQPTVFTLISQADQGNLGLIAKGRDLSDQARGWLYQGSGVWISDRAGEAGVFVGDLFDLAATGHEITFTAVVPGWEFRMGVDRDEDTYRDRDELDAGSDPADPASIPGGGPGDPPGRPVLRLPVPNPARAGTRLGYSVSREGPVILTVHDVRGRRVRVLVDDPDHPAGEFDPSWDLKDGRGLRVRGGIYFVHLSTEKGSTGRRVVVLN